MFIVAQTVKNQPAMQEALVQSLGREDSLEKEMATHSSILAWRIPWREEPGGLQSMGGVAKSWTSQTWLNEWALVHTHTHSHTHAHTTYKKWRSLGSAGWFGDLNVLFTCFKLSAAGRSSHPTILTSPYSGPQNLAINCATWIHVTGWGSYFTTACQRQLDFLLGLCA